MGDIKSAYGGFDILYHKCMGNTYLRGFFPTALHTETIAVNQMFFRSDTGISADIMQQSIAIGVIGRQAAAARSDILAGKGSINVNDPPIFRDLVNGRVLIQFQQFFGSVPLQDFLSLN